jgi:hypothetical protein
MDGIIAKLINYKYTTGQNIKEYINDCITQLTDLRNTKYQF